MNTEIVFAAYKPKEGKREELLALIKRHVPTLRNLGLITERPTILVSAKDGTFVEVFEWQSHEAAKLAHEHPEVAKIWEAMGVVGSFVGLDQLPESKKAFAHFTPIDLN